MLAVFTLGQLPLQIKGLASDASDSGDFYWRLFELSAVFIKPVIRESATASTLAALSSSPGKH